jgi:spore maturation protein CgeB
MNRVLYVGQYTRGTTSRMRADEISKIIKSTQFDVIDTHIPFFKTNRVFRTLGFRFKFGPLIAAINRYILQKLNSGSYDLIWIDKGIFITKDTIVLLRERAKRLVHYTPDMAFYDNKSKHFETAINLYDYVITTKSAEIDYYLNYVSKEKLVVTTQGFSKTIHKPYHSFSDKDDSIVFIGLAETYRFEMIEFLIENGIRVKLVGKGWENFIKRHKNNKNLVFIAESIYDENYCKLISLSKFALGLLSKKFPEYHTTRTFEIPACGTALITEKNIETNSFYENDEVIFYSSKEDVLSKINYYIKNNEELEQLSNKGLIKVNDKGFDYYSILHKIIEIIKIN